LFPQDVRFKAIIAPNTISAGALPQTTLEELTALLQTHCGCYLLLREGEGGDGRAWNGKRTDKGEKRGIPLLKS